MAKLRERAGQRVFAAPRGEARSVRAMRRGLLFFWGAWTAIVVLTNAADALKALGILPDWWAAASGNYGLLLTVTGIYRTPSSAAPILFGAVIVWEAVATLLYLRAALSCGQGGAELGAAIPAFAVSLGLWMAFMLADEVFLAYQIENTHRGIFTAQLVTLMTIWLLSPDRPRA